MKILVLGSVALPVPPPMQGGTERIAYWQAVGLAKRGHQVTLVAAKGSKPDPAYSLVEIGGGDTVAGSSRQAPSTKNQASNAGNFTEGSRNLRKEAMYLAQVSQYILDHGKEYDVILNNMRAGESLFVPAAKAVGVPFATVMHLPIFSELAGFFRDTNTPVITISNAQRQGFPDVRYAGTVYNCVDPELLEAPLSGKKSGGYLLIMGSIAPHKNQKDGILAARTLNKQIILAGKIGNTAYWEQEIAPHVDGTNVIHKGEMSMDDKIALLTGAEALLFPIVWPEPFGLVMIEAMAVGTPVVAYGNGAVPEVVKDEETGYIVDETQGAGALAVAVRKSGAIDPHACRRHVEANFSMSAMLDSLEKALSEILTDV